MMLAGYAAAAFAGLAGCPTLAASLFLRLGWETIKAWDPATETASYQAATSVAPQEPEEKGSGFSP